MQPIRYAIHTHGYIYTYYIYIIYICFLLNISLFLGDYIACCNDIVS